MYEMSISLSTTVLCWSSIRVLYGKKRFIVRQLQKKKKKKWQWNSTYEFGIENNVKTGKWVKSDLSGHFVIRHEHFYLHECLRNIIT